MSAYAVTVVTLVLFWLERDIGLSFYIWHVLCSRASLSLLLLLRYAILGYNFRQDSSSSDSTLLVLPGNRDS